MRMQSRAARMTASQRNVMISTVSQSPSSPSRWGVTLFRNGLYRFDKAAAQWKDRGIGDIKILGNTSMKRYRVIMRRDQVLKLCDNHYITTEMTLESNAGSENSLVWQAMDTSEGEPQMEELAVRLRLAGTTHRFETVFEECQAELRKQRAVSHHSLLRKGHPPARNTIEKLQSFQ
ncbi:E3 SUMO-protein ligase RanBP2-like [Acanthaster planci]|uniref:E3 SUMO-protein ligase RanBP2-like n=1 Tax=Acanthaster planci TaxID=133434 RepID=A0A8B7Y771_ACAPL|nr:E3 SUMO-protein ligase RanBP2-like [Acanthaster planci]